MRRDRTTWKETTEARYDEMLGVLPPAVWLGHGFLVGEPWDHDVNGRARFSAFVQLTAADGTRTYFEAQQPMTAAQFRALSRDDIVSRMGIQPDPVAAAMVSECAELLEQFGDYELGDL